MINLLRTRKIRREKLDSLSEIEKIREVEKENSVNQRIENLIQEKFSEIGMEQMMKDINSRLDEVSEKIDELKFIYQSNSRQKMSNSARKMKVKEMITLIIQQHGMLSAPQLSKLLNLSRTRCTEYLKEMEAKGILDADTNCRKRFYKLRQ